MTTPALVYIYIHILLIFLKEFGNPLPPSHLSGLLLKKEKLAVVVKVNPKGILCSTINGVYRTKMTMVDC